MKHLATPDKPTVAGWYLWWVADKPDPYHVLARVEKYGGIMAVNFHWDDDTANFVPLAGVGDRLWLKVSH